MRVLPPRSLRARITAVAVVGVCIAMVAVGMLLVRYVRVSLEHEMDDRLEVDTGQVAAVLPTLGQVHIEDGSVLGDPAGRTIQAVGTDGVMIGSSLYAAGVDRIPLLTAPFPWQTGPLPRTLTTEVEGRGTMRVRVTELDVEEVRYLVVARPVSSIDRAVTTVTRALLVGGPLIVALFGWMIWMTVGRALRPVEVLRRTVSDISANDLTGRVPAREPGDEIDRLAATMNDMLARLQAAADRERELVADASHELRSPLAAVRALVETRREVSGEVAAEHDAHALAAVARLQTLIDDLLDLSRFDSASAGDTEGTAVSSARRRSGLRLVDLDDLVLEQAYLLRHTTTLQIDTNGVSGGQVLGSEAALRRMLENLCSNASRHARGLIRFGVAETADAVVLEVADDGVGVPVAERIRVFDRFTRLAEGRERDKGGAGLGLAIVKGIVVGHGGTIEVTDRGEGSGAAFVARFPLPE